MLLNANRDNIFKKSDFEECFMKLEIAYIFKR